MTKNPDVSLLTTLAGLEAIEQGPRRYAAEPAADYHAEALRQEADRNPELRARLRWESEAELFEPSYEQFGEDQQGYHGDRR